ncbi:hypothetical protein CDAR_183171 [Caerostris darwini]|uniref:Uncharacterized protein n=1 Tax=Caerostris darwini TaxID=1538125 RepID=A0AAV4T5E7_9ARAC|nr:hypothetical protein CDAR_183171 [Caerostris darwini]
MDTRKCSTAVKKVEKEEMKGGSYFSVPSVDAPGRRNIPDSSFGNDQQGSQGWMRLVFLIAVRCPDATS